MAPPGALRGQGDQRGYYCASPSCVYEGLDGDVNLKDG
jgi:hypothetical protein